MRRSCDTCRQPYEAKRPASRFCSDNCRKRFSRGQVVDVPVPPVVEAEVPGTSVRAATLAELTEAGRELSALGQSALVVAARLDQGGESGAALAQLAKEHRAALAAACEGAARSASPLDELRRRREARRGA